MNWRKSRTPAVKEKERAAVERRSEPRIGGQVEVRYSGMDEDKIVMGYGTTVDLSRYGFGIHGGKRIKCGMELVLFLELPDTSDTLCIPQASVSGINGRRSAWNCAQDVTKTDLAGHPGLPGLGQGHRHRRGVDQTVLRRQAPATESPRRNRLRAFLLAYNVILQ